MNGNGDAKMGFTDYLQAREDIINDIATSDDPDYYDIDRIFRQTYEKGPSGYERVATPMQFWDTVMSSMKL